MRAVPLGREDESSAIYKLLEESIQEKEYGVLYVSGMPGCGKTLTCTSVLGIVKENHPSVAVVNVNCGSLILPSDVFTAIHQLIDPTVTHSTARLLEEALKQNVYTIILADEVDMLITKNQHILYGLLELPSLCKNLYIVAISNTFNLPDSKLTGKVRSRLGWNRLNFALYKRSQVIGILKEMNPEFEFTDEALEYCANKICTLNGDIRKAMQIQKHAMAHASRNSITKIEMEDMDRAIKYVYHSMQGSFIRSLSEYQKILLGIVARKGYSFPDSLYVDFRATLSLKQFPLPTFKEFQFLVEKMVEIGVLKGRSNSLAVETDYIPDELEIILEEEENDCLEVISI
ncbi:origin recognition complex subunit 1 [Nematocida ausubeli]|uniref:Origin recognition complex subunit 1 n=1 Tax=Nematocida ausubeli (strain ATCC PRA-371 / ERTm2) TaxID=1913371 RepID=H8ZD45_NEMA1|nr:uncharacterized protein NESG_00373 [Nematocida ausubeli]EHY65070.1 hypothetical protein NERG_01516 [Nematocida ausubeli]KAI5133656.1 origin recognition complex subunit 1 [Nematocida ausubeli]KAI5136053.1 origin recognition complex subunit 1 [Nematocida ausubeli]KAI5148900.1 origin recognition complex subunit 1 [Nematocida ausubeli]KAI5160794.1 origin recognition complex subunit 1 [Nematocida ausubeli]